MSKTATELKAEILRLKKEMKDDEQFADKIPEDDVDGPRNLPKLGLKSVQQAIQSAAKTEAAVKF